jgi:hypothetical protein
MPATARCGVLATSSVNYSTQPHYAHSPTQTSTNPDHPEAVNLSPLVSSATGGADRKQRPGGTEKYVNLGILYHLYHAR